MSDGKESKVNVKKVSCGDLGYLSSEAMWALQKNYQRGYQNW